MFIFISNLYTFVSVMVVSSFKKYPSFVLKYPVWFEFSDWKPVYLFFFFFLRVCPRLSSCKRSSLLLFCDMRKKETFYVTIVYTDKYGNFFFGARTATVIRL